MLFDGDFTEWYEAIRQLRQENEKLRECVETISKQTIKVGFYTEPTYEAQLAIETLKELEK